MRKTIALFIGLFVVQLAAAQVTNTREMPHKLPPFPPDEKSGGVVFFEDFNTFPFPGWTILTGEYSSVDGQWTQSQTSPTGSPFANVSWDNGNMQNESLISPLIALPADKQLTLSFNWLTSYYWMVQMNGANLEVLYSLDGGITWNDNPLFSEDNQTSITTSGGEWPFAEFTWYTATIDISAHAGTSQFLLAFYYYGNNGAQFALENLSITATTPTGHAAHTATNCRVYPNPASEQLCIENAAGAEIALYNSAGLCVVNRLAQSETEKIDISSFTKGVYILKIRTKTSVFTHKIIIFNRKI